MSPRRALTAETPPDHQEPTRLLRWEAFVAWPLVVAAVVFLATYSWTVLQPDLPVRTARWLRFVDYATWALFVVDYVVRLVLARPRGRWVLHHLPDLAIVALPLLRPLRLLRLITLLRIINRSATRSLQGRVAAYVALSTVLVLYAGALAELDAERGAAGSNITTFPTALWWAVTTITTVGYGDHFPVTTEGRLVAAALMVAGIALIGTVTASLASWLVGHVRAATAGAQPATATELQELRDEVRRLTAALQGRTPNSRST